MPALSVQRVLATMDRAVGSSAVGESIGALGGALGVGAGPRPGSSLTWEGQVLAAASDEELVDRFVRGESAAFAELLERYRDKVYQFACWNLMSGPEGRTEAEDATQEVFLQLFRSARSFRHRSKFRTWLYSLARNVCRQHAAKLRRRPLASWREEADDDPALDIPDGEPGPLALIEEEERQRVLRAAVQELPAHHRNVLLLRDWEDLSYEEIAEVLQVPVGTVRSRLFHARAALARQLAGYFRSEIHGL